MASNRVIVYERSYWQRPPESIYAWASISKGSFQLNELLGSGLSVHMALHSLCFTYDRVNEKLRNDPDYP